MLSIEQKMMSLVDEDLLVEVIKNRLSENIDRGIDVKQYLDKWVRNKKDLFVMFGEQLTLSQEVEYDITTNENACLSLIHQFSVKEFSSKEFALAKVLLQSLSVREVKENILDCDHNILGISLRRGERVSRALGRLILNGDAKQRDKLQTKYSMLIQSFSAKGRAVLSIDPIDYITMSENDSGWSSCHALDGCYRAGTLAYLQDKSTCISYVASSHNAVVNVNGERKEFTNKTWRQIVSFSMERDYAIQARQYPNMNDANQQTIAKMISDALSTSNGGAEYHSFAVDVNSRLEDLHQDFEYDEDTTVFYNDIAHQAFRTAFIVAQTKFNSTQDVHDAHRSHGNICVIGTYVDCLCGCGETLSNSAYLFYENAEYDY